MLVKIPYDGDIIDLEFPDGVTILTGKESGVASKEDARHKIRKAFSDIADKFSGKRILIIINDHTRRVPTEQILNILLELIPIEEIEILVATGTHAVPRQENLREILGGLYEQLESRIFCHDCDDGSVLQLIGTTSRGTPIEINKRFLEAEAVICINSVEPHFFAGFTGARKSIIPGVAGRNTVIANHSLAKSEDAKSLNLGSNPVHLDLEEAVKMAIRVPIFSIQSVLNRNGEIIDLFCGDLHDSFNKAVKLARNIYSIPIEKKFDIVFAIGEAPLDVNLYQLQKAQEHGAEAVADGGVLVVVGACNEGVGSRYFVDLANEYPTPESALSDAALSDNRFGIHKLVKTARRLRKIKIWYITKLDDNVIRKVYFEPKCSLHDALNDAIGILGSSASIAVLKDACFLVPVIIDSKGGMR